MARRPEKAMGKNRYRKMSRQLLTIRAHPLRVINRDEGLVMFVRYQTCYKALPRHGWLQVLVLTVLEI